MTTVVTGILKQAISPKEHGIGVCGGKGKASRRTPEEICRIGEDFGFSGDNIENLCRASKMSAKVDNTAVQAGYQLYHHAFFIGEDQKWAVVQQGMCTEDRTARRYHWLSSNMESFIFEPHTAIVGDIKRQKVLDMTSRESEGCRRVSTDLVKEEPKRLMRLLQSLKPDIQKSLNDWLPHSNEYQWRNPAERYLCMPRNINWKTIKEIYEFQPSNYEELLGFKGVGPATVRGLALVAEIIYGEKPSWKDPVKYSFAYGGKDGVPYPVDRKAMDKSIEFLKQAVEEAKIGEAERLRSLRSLTRFIPDQ